MVSLREFQREFRKHREAAAMGNEVVVIGPHGQRYVFKALPDSTVPRPATFGDLVGDLAGCVDSGVGDLATNKAHMKGFGRG